MEDINIQDILSIFFRRKISFCATAALLLIASAFFAFHWSNFRSTATVQIQQSDIPANMTMPMGMSQAEALRAIADQRIQQIQQRVISTANLIDIITKYDLYAGARRSAPIADIADGMRKKIKLQLLTNGSDAGGTQGKPSEQSPSIAFSLQFSYSDPLKTQQVTNELMTRFLDEDLKQRRAQSKGTSDFLQAQLNELEKSMSEHEKRIAAFRAEHPDNRPEQFALNQQLVTSTYQTLMGIETQMAALEKTHVDLQGQLATMDPYSRVLADGQVTTTPSIQLKALQAKYSSLLGTYSPDHPDVVRLRHQIEALQKELGQSEDTAQLQTQLDDARTKLTAAQSTYGANHPDVLALRQRVTKLEDRLATEAHDPTSHTAVKKDADNPAYLMMLSQIHANEQQYKALVAQRDGLQSQYQHYQANVAQAPAIEQEYAALSRDYENEQGRYRELKEKKQAADMNEQLDQQRIGDRLQVVDPPDLPSGTYPKRILLLAGGFLLSLVGGVAAVLVREISNPNVHGHRHLAALAGVPPLVVIPHIFTHEERQTLRRWRLQIGAASICIIIVAAIAYGQLVMPLDVLGDMLARRFGLL